MTAPAAWCSHPITVDEPSHGLGGRDVVDRTCITCGLSYDRAPVLERLRRAIRERHRLPPSPWTAAERSVDTA